MTNPQVVLERPDGSLVGPFKDREALFAWLRDQGQLPRDRRGLIRPVAVPDPPEIVGTLLARGLACAAVVLGLALTAGAARRPPAVVQAFEVAPACSPAQLAQVEAERAALARRVALLRGALEGVRRLSIEEAVAIAGHLSHGKRSPLDAQGRPREGSIWRDFFERAYQALERDRRLEGPGNMLPPRAAEARP